MAAVLPFDRGEPRKITFTPLEQARFNEIQAIRALQNQTILSCRLMLEKCDQQQTALMDEVGARVEAEDKAEAEAKKSTEAAQIGAPPAATPEPATAA